MIVKALRVYKPCPLGYLETYDFKMAFLKWFYIEGRNSTFSGIYDRLSSYLLHLAEALHSKILHPWPLTKDGKNYKFDDRHSRQYPNLLKRLTGAQLGDLERHITKLAKSDTYMTSEIEMV
jgi:hypothetical protein